MYSIVNGTRPTRPDNSMTVGLSDPLWDLLQSCWNGDRSRRPRMQDVEVQVRDAAVLWETPMPLRHRLVPFPQRPWDPLPNPVTVSPSPSSAGSRNSSASDLPRSNTPDIRIDVIGPEEGNLHPMQEFYPPPSPISPGPGGQSSEALINRLDGVSPRLVWSGSTLMQGLASRAGFRS